jgi:hypothetical protein
MDSRRLVGVLSVGSAQEMKIRHLETRAKLSRAEERHAAGMKRRLLVVDCERGNAPKLQKELEQARRILFKRLAILSLRTGSVSEYRKSLGIWFTRRAAGLFGSTWTLLRPSVT